MEDGMFTRITRLLMIGLTMLAFAFATGCSDDDDAPGQKDSKVTVTDSSATVDSGTTTDSTAADSAKTD